MTMAPLTRNQLVWLAPKAWSVLQAQPWDAQAQAILAHWRSQRLPLVVCRQRPHSPADQLCVGLPAPQPWSRRRLALTVAPDQLTACADFPTLAQVAHAQPWQAAAIALSNALGTLGVQARVFGSHGWQHLTGLAYVHDASDLDLSVAVHSLAQASGVVKLLASSTLHCRIDGEIVFAKGRAIAWRELQQLLQGTTPQVLVKDRHSVRLAAPPELRRWDGVHCAPQAAAQIGRAAVRALYAEISLEPKPGLVSFRDCGSHHDMDGGTFLRSLMALRGYFPRIAQAGAQGAALAVLQTLGIEAEARMLAATGGVNTHRGAVFGLGLLCASAGQLHTQGLPLTPWHLRSALLSTWGESLAARARSMRSAAPTSNGQRVAQRYGMRSAGDEAAQAFPTLFDTTLPALQAALAWGAGARAARVQALFATMAVLDDTNVVHRGGIEGLRFVQSSAARFIDRGGIRQADWLRQARALHLDFVQRRLSPGGAADVLASACWVEQLQPAAQGQALVQTAPSARAMPVALAWAP